ncbi:VOC family protein [Asanoa sp. NPDC050611]|uniref:VOC family protein n=1 Tax=Asanoa sp. NPDC050611 TaxID=3157098 RepID=UPI0033CE4E16
MKVDAITLAVEDLNRAKRFYGDGLGCQVVQDQPQYVAFSLGKGSSGLSLYPRRALAHDAGVEAQGSGFAGFTFNYFVAAEQEVDEVLGRAEKAGGTIMRPAQQAQWGGYFGYFADPDGYLWKVVVASQE